MQNSIDNENIFREKSFLGIDFGSSKIGLAIADEETRIAFALGMLKNDKDLLLKLAEIIKEKNVSRIIIGMTRHGKDASGGGEKRMFGKKIEDRFGIQVDFFEEMFSTKMAHDNIKLRGGKNIAKFDDQEAARIILQGWLEVNEAV